MSLSGVIMKIRDIEVNKVKSSIVRGQAFLVIRDKRGIPVGTVNIINPSMFRSLGIMMKNKQPINLEMFLEKPWIEELVV